MGLEDYPIDLTGVYRILRDLEEQGSVHSAWDLNTTGGPPRRVYTITPQGKAHLEQWVKDLQATDRILHLFLDAYDQLLQKSAASSNGE